MKISTYKPTRAQYIIQNVMNYDTTCTYTMSLPQTLNQVSPCGSDRNDLVSTTPDDRYP